MKRSSTIRTSIYWYITFLIVAALGVGSAVWIGVNTAADTKNSLLERTETIAKLVPAESIQKLEGSEADLESPTYQQLKSSFIDVRKANHDIRFIYILALDQNEQAFFHVDSEPADSEDYSPPGQEYPEDEGDTNETYASGESWVLPITSDRWGNWLSAYSPIKDDSGEVVGVLGLDVPANNYYMQIALNASIPLLLATIVIVLLILTKRKSQYQSQYVSAKAFFLSFAGHEIRSPLTAIAKALKHKKDPTTIKKVEDSLDHILNTIDDVLSLQATESLQAQGTHKKPTRISSLVDDTISSLSLLAEQRDIHVINATIEANRDLEVMIDPLLFERVVSNFLVNAIKYSPEGAKVTVTIARTEKNWFVQFHNEGPGIPKNEQAKLLKGFYRTKAARQSGQKGTGLGMVLAHDIIHDHKGKLELESEPNKGVIFRILMPR